MTTFGYQLPNFSYGTPDAEMFAGAVARVRAAEAAGFENVWVMDHFYQLPALGGAPQPILEAYTLLGALAAVTERVHLGTLVTGVTYRNPAMLAKQVTTLDVISKGRAILGIGAAWHDIEHEGLGFDFPAVKERMDRLEEAVQICRAMFTEEAPSFSGRYYRTSEVRNVPRPLRGAIPIMIGGSGEQRTLKLVARYADLCNISGDAATIRHKLEVLRGHCTTVGRDPQEITTTRLASLFLTNSAEETAGTKEFIVSAAGAEALAGFNIGEEHEIVSQVDELIAVGVDTLIFNLPFGDPDTVQRVGELLVSKFQ
jgi:F420-dependent oxidoreductase-like protein